VLYAQREFAPAQYPAMVTRLRSARQVPVAFGPMAAGQLLAAALTP
jgi:hypothetical protein